MMELCGGYEGKKVVFMRDLTDSMYNPERPPGVDHFTGHDLIIGHVERYWCPSITSDAITGGTDPATVVILDFLGIRLDPVKADGIAFTANLITPDNGEQYVIELSNGALTNLKGFLAEDPDLTITINRTDLELAMMGAAPLMEQVNQNYRQKLEPLQTPKQRRISGHQENDCSIDSHIRTRFIDHSDYAKRNRDLLKF